MRGWKYILETTASTDPVCSQEIFVGEGLPKRNIAQFYSADAVGASLASMEWWRGASVFLDPEAAEAEDCAEAGHLLVVAATWTRYGAPLRISICLQHSPVESMPDELAPCAALESSMLAISPTPSALRYKVLQSIEVHVHGGKDLQVSIKLD